MSSQNIGSVQSSSDANLYDGVDMKLHYNIISQKFGKYTDQFIEMMSWAMPPEFFVRN